MLDNQFKTYLDEFLKSALYYQGSLMHILNLNKSYSSLVEQKKAHFSNSSILSLRDVSRLNHEEFDYPNLHPVDGKFEVNPENLDKHNNEAEYFICANTLCQLVESYERFLIDIFFEHFNNQITTENPLGVLSKGIRTKKTQRTD